MKRGGHHPTYHHHSGTMGPQVVHNGTHRGARYHHHNNNVNNSVANNGRPFRMDQVVTYGHPYNITNSGPNPTTTVSFHQFNSTRNSSNSASSSTSGSLGVVNNGFNNYNNHGGTTGSPGVVAAAGTSQGISSQPQWYNNGASHHHHHHSSPSNNNSSTSGSRNSPVSPANSHPISGGDMPPVETVVARLETACKLLHGIGGNNTRINEISVEISILSDDLRHVGPLLEASYPDVLDRVMSSMRDASAQPCLPPSLRLAIFELVESRAAKWMLPSDSCNYYRQRRNLNDATGQLTDEVISSGASNRHSSGSFTKPEPIYPVLSNSPDSSSRNYREEILIKNSDSGKVMGVRGRRVHIIEALSDTIISFEKVSNTAKERCLTINGSSLQSINLAKQLIQETITRNASPVFDGHVMDLETECDTDEETLTNSMKRLHTNSTSKMEADCCTSRFSYSVHIGEDVIKISGSNLQHVQEAKLALDQYFSTNHAELFNGSNEIEDCDEVLKIDTTRLFPRKVYDRDELLNIFHDGIESHDFSHLEPDIRKSIVCEKPRPFNPDAHKESLQRMKLSPESTCNMIPG